MYLKHFIFLFFLKFFADRLLLYINLMFLFNFKIVFVSQNRRTRLERAVYCF